MAEGTSSFRSLHGVPSWIASALLAIITLLGASWAVQLHQHLGIPLFKEQMLGAILGLGLGACFLGVKARRSEQGNRVPAYDWILAATGFACGGYVAVLYPDISLTLGDLNWERIAIGAIVLVLVCEASRRLIGWSLIVVALIFALYARFSDLLPGILNAPPSSAERIVVYLFLDNGGLLGAPLDVAATVIIPFILFGVLLTIVGADGFITNLALAAMGRFRGGPAKVSVLASCLFGTVSGSAVSNVAMVGPITIPMMKRAGYPAHIAGAIEAVASTGGQIMPPVMGITAFLIADYLSIPYLEVIAAALIPALLYYLALFIQVDLEAGKRDLRGLPAVEIPRVRETMRAGGIFMVPLGVLIYTMVLAEWDPGPAGMAASFATVVVALFRRDRRPTAKALFRALVVSGRAMLDLIVLCALAGVIIGALQVSGLSFSFSNVMLQVAGGNLILLLIMTGIVCIILGMALPTAVIYTMLAVLVAPALTQLGVLPIAAHLFLFYMGMLSMITPPVCMATFAAATIAGASFWKSGVVGMRLGIVAFAIPFAFPFSTGLLMHGGVFEVVISVITASIGVLLISCGLAGYAFATFGWLARGALFASGLMLIPSPTTSSEALFMNVAGLVIGGGLIGVQARRARKAGQSTSGPSLARAAGLE